MWECRSHVASAQKCNIKRRSEVRLDRNSQEFALVWGTFMEIDALRDDKS